MVDVINLKQKRKEKSRSEKEKVSEQNRAKFGRTKEEKKRDKLNAEKSRKHIDGHKLENGED